MKQPERQLLEEIVRGAQLIFENAKNLYNEAQLLGRSGAFARALTLHQISMQECSTIDMLGAAGHQRAHGDPVQLNHLATKFRQHKVKNYNTAYWSVVTDAETESSTAKPIPRGASPSQ